MTVTENWGPAITEDCFYRGFRDAITEFDPLMTYDKDRDDHRLIRFVRNSIRKEDCFDSIRFDEVEILECSRAIVPDFTVAEFGRARAALDAEIVFTRDDSIGRLVSSSPKCKLGRPPHRLDRDRNRWIKQEKRNGKTLLQIVESLAQLAPSKGWHRITSPQGIHDVLKRKAKSKRL